MFLPPTITLGFAAFTFFTPAARASEWLKLTTPHFTLYTDGSEKDARSAMLEFERVRTFFLQSSALADRDPRPVRIVGFRSSAEYEPYRNNEVSVAYYTHDQDRDYIVLSDLSAAHLPAMIHEYTHLALDHSGLKLPLWLNEGWADLNSSLELRGKKVMIGDVLPGRAETLARGGWIPLSVLDRTEHDSALYNERGQAALFYAESWALTHMLFLGAEYRNGFSALVRSLSAGKSLAQAAQIVYGKSIDDLDRDLRHYLARRNLVGAVFNIDLRADEVELRVERAGDFESQLVLADVLVAAHRYKEARDAYFKLDAQYPKRPELQESLGYLELREGDVDEARRRFQASISLGSRNPVMCYRLGLLSIGRDLVNDRISAFRRAVELDPAYEDARLQLGLALLDDKEFRASLNELKQLRRITDTNAPFYFSAVAYDEMQLGATEDARRNAAEAKKRAKTPDQSRQADWLLNHLEGGPKQLTNPPN